MDYLNTLIDKILKQRVLTHLLYWTIAVGIWVLFGSMGLDSIGRAMAVKLRYLPSQIIAAYALMYYQIPKLLYRKKYVAFGLSFLLTAYITTALARFLNIYFFESIYYPELAKDSIYNILTYIQPLVLQYFMWVYLFAFFTTIIKLLKEHFKEKQQIEILQRAKARAELGFLKAQLHPHFLFNTLNNLYTLTLCKADAAPEVVQKLAGILDYSFYQELDKEIPINKEIELIQNYIDLELLRYGKRLELHFDQQIESPNVTIAPLLLLSMVENAFKHGASGDHQQPKINISLQVKECLLHFNVFNTKPPFAQTDLSNFKKGIGSSNVNRQLELIYPKKHQLTIKEDLKSYQVDLRIELKVVDGLII